MSREKTQLGKRRISFSIREAYHDLPITVPCGQCNACKLEHARQWAVRCTHEAQLHQQNAFVTLTYDNKHLPPHASLRPRDFVLFMKRLRKHLTKKCECGILHHVRFLQAGEYGKLGRPHHHAILFDCHFPDQKTFRETSPGNITYRSAILESLWNQGFSSIGSVTPQSAAYVARYTLKKHTSDPNDNTRSIRHPEYITMSRRPGIGQAWLERYYSDVYPTDEIATRDGRTSRPPRYYDERLRAKDPALYAQLKRRRIDAINLDETSSSRVLQKQTNLQRRIDDYLKRNL